MRLKIDCGQITRLMAQSSQELRVSSQMLESRHAREVISDVMRLLELDAG